MRKLARMMHTRVDKKPSGFTLIEVVMVTVIIGILAAVTAPSLENWKNLQLLRAKQQGLLATLETMKADASRWGAQCTIDGNTLQTSCTSNLLEKKNNDVMTPKTSTARIIEPTAKQENEANIFIATNFDKITISPRGFMHVNTGSTLDKNAVFVIGHQHTSTQFNPSEVELCIVVQHLTGRISTGKKTQSSGKLQISKAIQKSTNLSSTQCQI